MIRSLPAILVAGLVPVVDAGSESGGSDPLSSWNDGPSKPAILDFVAAVTDRRNPNDVKPADCSPTPDSNSARVSNSGFTLRDESVVGADVPHSSHSLSLAIPVVAARSAAAHVTGFDDATVARMTRLSLQEEPPPAVIAETPALEPAAAGEFEKGAWTFQTYGSAIFGDSGKGEMYLAHVGFGYYFQADQSVNVDLFGGYVRSGIDDNGAAAGFDLVYRNHFIKRNDERMTLFFNAGAGLQQQSTEFSGSRHFNTRLLIGFGGTCRIGEKTRLLLGANYLHISDAGLAGGGGGGFDGPMLYGGIKISF